MPKKQTPCRIFRHSTRRDGLFSGFYGLTAQPNANFADMKRISAIISVLLMTVQSLMAQMTLNDCLIYARDHAHANIISRLEAEKSDADRGIAAARLLPYVELYSNGNLSFGRNIDPETNTYDNKKTLATGFGLQMSLPLFDGLVSINNLKAADVARMRQTQAEQAEQDRISFEVIRSFYNVSFCKAMVQQMREQLERDSTDLAATRRGYDLGTKSGADVAEMAAIVASDEYELSNQINLLAKAYLKLRSDMGMELSDSPLDLTETVWPETPADLNAVNPRIAEAELHLRECRLYLKAAKGAFSPSISLNSGISTSYYRMIGSESFAPSFREQWKNNMGEYIGLSISIPLFTGLSTTNRVKKALLEVKQSRTRLDQTIYEIEKAAAEAELDLKAATDELTAAVKRLDAEQLAFSAVRRRFELGDASAIDLYTSGARLANARANLEGKRIQKIISAITSAYYHGEKLIKE